MAHFEEVVVGCDALAFVSFSDELEGSAIVAGVAREILTAMIHSKRVFDLQYDREENRVTPCELTGGRLHGRILTITETRMRIAAIREARS
ncbi:hypothetical protein [Aureimonas sp. ME7]|uniref:hypothetical protein n=1 Tax=Aureimonas sp. ME7 TaxID=2744252 RepID=UPI0015F9E514|nr:hypothetical protein [Aureimonas sp. ME7]